MEVITIYLHNTTMRKRPSRAVGKTAAGLAITTFGVDSRHAPEWECNRPNGSGDYLIMCFSTPFLALTTDGRRQGVPGDCLINTPDFPNWHGSVPQAVDGFRNDYIHLDGTLVPELLDRYGLPLNVLFHVGDTRVMSTMLDDIRQERHNNEVFWTDAIRCQIEMLMLSLARARDIQTVRTSLSRSEQSWRPRFQEFRARLHAEFQEPWQVAGMAARLRLSENRFGALYRGFFRVSPIEDLIRVRIDQAKTMLSNSALPVGAVAEACGFASVFYFCRVFRQRVGMSPGVFARRNGSSRST